MAWTDEERAEVIKKYQDAEPTPENSMDIVSQIAEDMDKTVNGVRMILMKAEVYVKKEETSSKGSGSKSAASGASKRVSKEDAHAALRDAISAKGLAPDEDIVGKMTGKAALYFVEVLNAAAE